MATKQLIETHGDALRLAIRALRDHIDLISDDFNEGNYWFGGDNQAHAEQVLRNYNDALDVLEGELLPEEERWEAENGYSDDNGNRIRGGLA